MRRQQHRDLNPQSNHMILTQPVMSHMLMSGSNTAEQQESHEYTHSAFGMGGPAGVDPHLDTDKTASTYNTKTRNIATNSDLMTKSEHDGL